MLLIRTSENCCYRGDAAVVVLQFGFHGDERGAILLLLRLLPHPSTPQTAVVLLQICEPSPLNPKQPQLQ